MFHRSLTGLVAVGMLCVLVSAAWADDEDFYEAEPYPREFVRRPLLLAPEMMEVRLGAASDFVGNDTDRVRTQADISYSVGKRFQVGFTSVLAALPTDGFAVEDMAVYGEYSLVRSMNLRLGGYMTAPRDEADELDATFGGRIGLPMKFESSENTALMLVPEFSIASEEKRFNGPIIFWVQLGSRMALSADAGLRLEAMELTDESAALPVGAGLHLSITRIFDLNVQVRVSDVTESGPAGRDDLWLLGFLAFRG